MKCALVPVVVVCLGLLAPSGSQAASTGKVCARGLDPEGGTLIARGVSCATARRVHTKLAQQTTLPPYRLRVAGRTWRCDYTSHTNRLTRMVCRSGRASVTVRIAG